MTLLDVVRELAVNHPVHMIGLREKDGAYGWEAWLCTFCHRVTLKGLDENIEHATDCPWLVVPQIVAALEAARAAVLAGPPLYGDHSCTCGATMKAFSRVDGTIIPVDPLQAHGRYSVCHWRNQVVALGMEADVRALLNDDESKATDLVDG